ncbi:MAG: hypothetical protein IKJ88_00870 [Clostridia bacterium]|nr:hypothetical protein [Clostridia bacterium]
MQDRLIELLEDTLHEWECDAQPETISQIAEHLLENGVIVPPCKVGDTVFQVGTDRKIYQFTISKLIYDTDGIAFDERAIGKSIFLTKAEAEQALRKEDEGK